MGGWGGGGGLGWGVCGVVFGGGGGLGGGGWGVWVMFGWMRVKPVFSFMGAVLSNLGRYSQRAGPSWFELPMTTRVKHIEGS